jgi:hypothetical protein
MILEGTFDSRILAKMNFALDRFARLLPTASRILFASALPSKSSSVRAAAKRRSVN